MNIAVITGASSGIGKEFAIQLDGYGMDELWLVARHEDRLKELRSRLVTPSRLLPLDLTKETEIKQYSDFLEETGANIMYLVNDSGFGKFGRYDEVSHRDAADMIDLNAKALVLMTMHSLPYMGEGGAIIQMSSSAAFQPLPYFSVYAASKAFVYSYSRALREEVRDRNIAVTTVCPGWVQTRFLEIASECGVRFLPKKFSPIYQPKDVVEKALKDSDKDRATSIYGIHTQLHRMLSKLLPSCLMSKCFIKTTEIPKK